MVMNNQMKLQKNNTNTLETIWTKIRRCLVLLDSLAPSVESGLADTHETIKSIGTMLQQVSVDL